MAAKQCPMAFDDLGGEDGFRLDIGQDLPCRVRRRPLDVTII
jgi:hypothetical protein